MEDGIKRYYTFEYLSEDSSDNMAESISELEAFLQKKEVYLYSGLSNYREELARIGVILINNGFTVTTIVYKTNLEDEASRIEASIKDYAKSLNILIKDVRATLDYGIICEKLDGKLLYLTEEVVMPGDITDMEAFLYPYIDKLQSNGHTLVLTDPYLYGSAESDYLDLVKKLFIRSGASEIKSFMPSKRNNATYQTIDRSLGNVTFTFCPYTDCHDRFWICPETKKGFVMGTSLNGLGARIGRIDMLREDEIKALMDGLGL